MNASSLPLTFFWRTVRYANHRLARGGPSQRLRNDIQLQWKRQKLPSPRPHAANQQVRIRLRRIDHHRCRAIGSNAFHQFQRKLRIAVQVNDDHIVMLFEQARHVAQAGRIGSKRANLVAGTTGQGNHHRLAAPFVRPNQRNRQIIRARRFDRCDAGYGDVWALIDSPFSASRRSSCMFVND